MRCVARYRAGYFASGFFSGVVLAWARASTPAASSQSFFHACRSASGSLPSASGPRTPARSGSASQLCKTLVETFAALEDAIAAYNAAMQAAYETLQPHVERYNSTVQDAGEWLADLVSAMEAYQDERSEAWQDSATGQAYEAWLDAYRSADLETVAIEAPEELEISDHGPQADVLDLPTCPEA